MSDINLLEQVQKYYQTHSKEEIDKVWKEVENDNSNNIDLDMEEQIKDIRSKYDSLSEDIKNAAKAKGWAFSTS